MRNSPSFADFALLCRDPVTVRKDGPLIFLQYGPSNGPKAEVRLKQQIDLAVAADENTDSPADNGGNQPGLTFFEIQTVLWPNEIPDSLASK
jgi:hypothetical protein